jgi:hypothetical protein
MQKYERVPRQLFAHHRDHIARLHEASGGLTDRPFALQAARP